MAADIEVTATASYGHDNNGNTTSVGSTIYAYSPFNMMRSATVNGVETFYAYDADQQRRRTGANGVEYFVHGPGYVPLAEYREVNGELTWVRDYIYAGSRLIASVAPVVPPPSYSFLMIRWLRAAPRSRRCT